MTIRREGRNTPAQWDGRGQETGSPRLVKRSLAIAGHKTSLALEPEFWTALENAAEEADKPVARLVAEIDAGRPSGAEGRSLASAVRVWLLARARSTS